MADGSNISNDDNNPNSGSSGGGRVPPDLPDGYMLDPNDPFGIDVIPIPGRAVAQVRLDARDFERGGRKTFDNNDGRVIAAHELIDAQLLIQRLQQHAAGNYCMDQTQIAAAKTLLDRVLGIAKTRDSIPERNSRLEIDSTDPVEASQEYMRLVSGE